MELAQTNHSTSKTNWTMMIIEKCLKRKSADEYKNKVVADSLQANMDLDTCGIDPDINPCGDANEY